MMMRHAWLNRTGWIVLAILVAMAPSVATAGGLRCSIGEIVVDNLKIGQTYSLQKLANVPLAVTNTGDQEIEVLIEALVPDSVELRHGAAPVPDARWAWTVPGRLRLGAQETQYADIHLAIPDDTALLGRSFQVILWSHSLPVPGQMLAIGLKSRILFTIDSVEDTTTTTPTGDLAVSLQPDEWRFEKLIPGRNYKLEQAARKPLRLRNTSDHPITVHLEALTAKSAGVDLGNECVDLLSAGVLRLEPASVTLEPGEEKLVTGTLVLTREPSVKTLGCIISAEVTGQPVRTRIYSRLYAQTR